MKKSLFLLASLLAASVAACFAGCKTQFDTGSNGVKATPKGGVVALEESGSADGNLKVTGMPKVRFDFKDGTPA